MNIAILSIAEIQEKILDIYKNDTKRFCFAQLLFVTSISFGWYIADGYRRGLFLLAILLLDKSQRKISVIHYWKGFTRIAGISLIVLGLWVIFIPLLFGIESFWDRINGTARPIEIFLYIVGVMIFSKDIFFEKYLCQFSAVSAAILSFYAFMHRLLLSFSTYRDDWIFNKHAAFAGLVLASLLPWLFWALCDKRNTPRFKTFCLSAIPFTLIAILVTYYRTIWVAVVVQVICAIPLSCYCFNIKILRHKKLLVTIVMLTLMVISFSYNNSFEIKDNINSFVNINSGFERFTSNRGEIWQEAISLISARKFNGFGWVDYNDFAMIKKSHPHSSYLQAAFHAGIPAAVLYTGVLVIFCILALKNLFCKRELHSISYVVLLMIIITVVSGLTESFFYTSREYLIPFWSILSVLISPLYTKKGNEVCYEKRF